MASEKNARLLCSRSNIGVLFDGLFVNGNLKKSGGIILHCQHDHHGVSDCSGKYPTWLDPDNYTQGGAVLASKTLHF